MKNEPKQTRSIWNRKSVIAASAYAYKRRGMKKNIVTEAVLKECAIEIFQEIADYVRDFGVPAELDGLIDSDPENEGIRYGYEFIGLVNGMLIKDFIKIGYSFDTSTKEMTQAVRGIKDNWKDVDEIRERLHFINMPDLTKYFKISTGN